MTFFKIFPQHVRDEENRLLKITYGLIFLGVFPKSYKMNNKISEPLCRVIFWRFFPKTYKVKKIFYKTRSRIRKDGLQQGRYFAHWIWQKKRTFEFHEVLPHFVLLHILFKYIKDIKLISKIFAEENNFQDHYVESDILGMFPQKDTVKKTIFQTIM